MTEPFSLLPLAQAVGGFFLALATVVVPMTTILTYGNPTPAVRTTTKSGAVEKTASHFVP